MLFRARAAVSGGLRPAQGAHVCDRQPHGGGVAQNLNKIEKSDIHARLGLTKGKYILLSAHREENIDTEKNFVSLFTAINKMAEKYDMPILYSCHPRSRKRLEQSGFQLDRRVIPARAAGLPRLQLPADDRLLCGERFWHAAGGEQFLHQRGPSVPGGVHPHQHGAPRSAGLGRLHPRGIDAVSLLQAVDTAVTMNQNGDHGIPVPDYVEENVSTKVVKIIQSYTGVVNKMVWRKG